jgi:hypothetical protein
MQVRFKFGRKFEPEDLQQKQEEVVYIKDENGNLKKVEDEEDEDC